MEAITRKAPRGDLTQGIHGRKLLPFVARFGLGPAGAAIATVISQALSAVLVCRKIIAAEYFSFRSSSFTIDKGVLHRLLKVSLPQVIQLVLTNTSFLLIGGLINAFGVNQSAAAGAVSKMWSFTVLTGQAMMTAMISMCAQNYAIHLSRCVVQSLQPT